MQHENNEYCTCGCPNGVYTETGEFGQWDVCCKCGKVIEDSFEYYNHYDGEDHIVDY